MYDHHFLGNIQGDYCPQVVSNFTLHYSHCLIDNTTITQLER